MALNIGTLDRYVTIQSVSYADDDYGDGQTPTWSNYAVDVPMRFEYPGRTSGVDEKFEASQLVAVEVNIWLARYDSGITQEMRIVYNSTNYYIVRLETIGRNEAVKLVTEKRDNE